MLDRSCSKTKSADAPGATWKIPNFLRRAVSVALLVCGGQLGRRKVLDRVCFHSFFADVLCCSQGHPANKKTRSQKPPRGVNICPNTRVPPQNIPPENRQSPGCPSSISCGFRRGSAGTPGSQWANISKQGRGPLRSRKDDALPHPKPKVNPKTRP